jgi:hypothetical protein
MKTEKNPGLTPETDWYGQMREIRLKISPGSEKGQVLLSTAPGHGRTFRQAIIDGELEKAKQGKIIEI